MRVSPYTKLFWNEYQLNPQRSDYNIIFDQRITGNLNVDKLSSCLEELISDHCILDSHINEVDNNLYWQKNTQWKNTQI